MIDLSEKLNNFITGLDLEHQKLEVLKSCIKTEILDRSNSLKLSILDKGIEKSFVQPLINLYPSLLYIQPDGVNIDFENKEMFSPYPEIGTIPDIDTNSLDFLGTEIKEACICINSLSSDGIKSQWLGRNALSPQQFWSSTKLIAAICLISHIGTYFPELNINECFIEGSVDELETKHSIYEIIKDIVSYENNIASSNSLAAMLKRLISRIRLEEWLKVITGNNNLEFRGDYGEKAFIDYPKVTNKNSEVLLQADHDTNKGQNLITAYDLTRILSMVGWHKHLSLESQLPGIRYQNLTPIIKGMGFDTARYIDFALEQLNLKNKIFCPVVMSKLGFGITDTNNTAQLTYTALLQFLDPSSLTPKIKSICMTLRAEKFIKDMDNPDFESVLIDSIMATEVTEIIKRLVGN